MALQSERGMSRIFADGLPAATGSTSILSLPRTLMELVLEEVSRKSQGLLAATVCREWAEMAQGCAKVAKLRKGRHLPSLRALPRLESLSLRPDLHDYYHDIPDTTDLNASDFSEFADAFAHLGELQTLEWKLCREIPEAILRLPALKLLRLEGDLSFVPKDVTRLTQLEELEVRISRCGGPPLVVPSELGSMRSLRVLRLDKVPQDHFPASIPDLVGLRALDLSFSWESDSPPAGAWLLDPVFRLTGLKELTLSVPSSLTRFPDSLGNLTRLRMLVLWGHAYELPDSLSQLTQLASFEMFNWMDVFPEVVSTLTSLKHLYLMAEGAARVPESLSRLSRLTSLNLSPGIIGGDFQLPDFFGSFPELKTLIVGSRLVTLPPSLTQLTKLRSLDISQAYLLGTPPDQSLRRRNPPPEPAVVESRARQVDFALGLPALESLRLRLGGPQGCDFPRAICNLTNLRQLQIMSTGKQGGLTHLPTSLGSLRNLTVLSISSMAVSSLPASLGNLILLRQFHLSSLHQLTEIPESIGQMEALEDLRIQCCHKLTQLPSSLGSLTKLVTLMLKDLPDLECLPDGIGNLPLLRRLDLGSLDKVQALPDDFSNLSALEVRSASSGSAQVLWNGCVAVIVLQC